MLISIFITEETAWFRSLKHDCTALFVNLLYFSLSLSFVCFSLLFFQFVILYTVDTFSVRPWYGAMFSSVFSSLYICFYSNKYFDCCWTFQIVSRVEKWQSLMKKIAQMFKMFLIQVWFPSEDWLLYKKKKNGDRTYVRLVRSHSLIMSEHVHAFECERCFSQLIQSVHVQWLCSFAIPVEATVKCSIFINNVTRQTTTPHHDRSSPPVISASLCHIFLCFHR